MSNSNFIIAVDQASNVSGYAIYEDGNLVKHGKVKFEGSSTERINQVKVWLGGMVTELKQESDEVEVVLEDIQLQKDVVTFKTLAWLQGVLLDMLHEKGIKTELVFSTEWKSTCGVKGRGRTEQKQNAQKYVQDEFGIRATQDECDAICLGYHTVKKMNSVINWD